jgi:hypothetical protein
LAIGSSLWLLLSGEVNLSLGVAVVVMVAGAVSFARMAWWRRILDTLVLLFLFLSPPPRSFDIL